MLKKESKIFKEVMNVRTIGLKDILFCDFLVGNIELQLVCGQMVTGKNYLIFGTTLCEGQTFSSKTPVY